MTMTQSDHFRLLTQRPHRAVGGIVVAVDDGLPLPDAAWYNATRAQAQALYDAEKNPAPAVRPVYAVTMGALRIALGRDLCIRVAAWIQGIQDTNQKHIATCWWEYSPSVRSNHPVVEQFRQAIGKTDDEAHAIFAAAYAIDNP